MPARNASGLRYFLTDGLILALLLVGVFALLSASGEPGRVVTAWGTVAAGYAAVRSALERFERPARLCWGAIGLVAVIWSFRSSDNLQTTVFLTIVIAAALQVAAIVMRSAFLARFSAVGMIVLLAALYSMAQTTFWIYLPYLAIHAAAVVLLAPKASGLAASPPVWWGLIRSRHMVWLRRSWRVGVGFVSKVPFVGLLVTVPQSFARWLRYFRGDSPADFWDNVLGLAAQILLVLITTEQVRLYGEAAGWTVTEYWYGRAAVWMGWGIGVSLCSQLNGSPYLKALGVLFVLVPVLMEVQRWIELKQWAPESGTFYAWFALLAGSSILAMVLFDRARTVLVGTPGIAPTGKGAEPAGPTHGQRSEAIHDRNGAGRRSAP